MDIDGSESCSITISSFPAGSVLHFVDDKADLTNTMSLPPDATLVDISKGAASFSCEMVSATVLLLLPPKDWDVDIDLLVLAVTKEESNGDQAQVVSPLGVQIIAVNDAPILSGVPVAASMEEDSTLVILGISVFDVDSSSGSIAVSIAVSHGRIELPSDMRRCQETTVNRLQRELVCMP